MKVQGGADAAATANAASQAIAQAIATAYAAASSKTTVQGANFVLRNSSAMMPRCT